MNHTRRILPHWDVKHISRGIALSLRRESPNKFRPHLWALVESRKSRTAELITLEFDSHYPLDNMFPIEGVAKRILEYIETVEGATVGGMLATVEVRCGHHQAFEVIEFILEVAEEALETTLATYAEFCREHYGEQ